MKNIPVYAWDNGFGVDKFFTQIADQSGRDVSKKLAFPSVTLKMEGRNESTAALSLFHQGFSLEKMIIEYQGILYAVGKFAIIQDQKAAYRTFAKNKFQEPIETVKLLASLVILFPGEERIRIDDLALGLSLESFREYHREIEEHFARQSFLFSYLTKDGLRPATVEIGEVHCIPQGIGAFWDVFFEIDADGVIGTSDRSKEFFHQRYGICDIGDKTIDAHCFAGLEPLQNTEVKFDNGISEAYKRVAAKLNNCPEILVEETYLDYVCNRPGPKPLYWSGKYYTIDEIQPLCEKAFRDIGEEIVNTMLKKWSKQLDTLELVILCGGIANTLKEFFAAKMPCQVVTTDDPQFSNVRGYFKSRIFRLQRTDMRM
jgi:hypothetical protein